MSRKFLTPIDLGKNELQNAAVQGLGAAPSAPVKFQLYGNTGDNTLYWWDGTTWQSAKGGAASFPGYGSITAETTFGTAKSDGVATTVARSDHGHGNPAHDNAAHANVNLNALLYPTGPVNFNNQQLTSLGAPIGSSDAVNKGYVDGLVMGLSWKDTVRAATTADLATFTPGPSVVDGVTLATGDRVLVKNQASAFGNGIFTVFAGGNWGRASDADSEAELLNAAVWVSEGTTQADTAWVMTTNAPIAVGTTPLTWTQFAGPGSVVAGNGLTLTGTTIDLVAGDTSLTVAANDVRVNTAVIATVASLSGYQPLDTDLTALAGVGAGVKGIYVKTGDGTATGRIVTGGAGPIAVTNGDGATGNIVLDINNFSTVMKGSVPPPGSATGKFLKDDGTWGTPAAGLVKYVNATVGGAISQLINHALNTRNVLVEVFRTATPWDTVDCDIERTDVNNVTLRFAVAPAANEYTVVVVG